MGHSSAACSPVSSYSLVFFLVSLSQELSIPSMWQFNLKALFYLFIFCHLCPSYHSFSSCFTSQAIRREFSLRSIKLTYIVGEHEGMKAHGKQLARKVKNDAAHSRENTGELGLKAVGCWMDGSRSFLQSLRLSPSGTLGTCLGISFVFRMSHFAVGKKVRPNSKTSFKAQV